MIVKKSKQIKRLKGLLASSTRPPPPPQNDDTAAAADANELHSPASSSVFNETENGEENVVIDMVDEDDDDEDDDENINNKQSLAHKDELQSSTKSKRAPCDEQQVIEMQSAQVHLNQAAKMYSTNTTKHNDNQHTTTTHQLTTFNTGDLIWFDPNQLGHSIPGKVLDFYPDLSVLTVEGCGQPLALDDPQLDDTSRERLLLQADEQLQVYELSDAQMFRTIKRRDPVESTSGTRDLLDLRELSLESIIYNLKLRFKQQDSDGEPLVYTKCGQRILVSVNPHKQLVNLYNLHQANKYDTISAQKLAQMTQLNKSKNGHKTKAAQQLIRWLLLSSSSSSMLHNETTAHVFEMANEALAALLIDCRDQCFVLLGDSGSGKTEHAKLLVQYFATVNKSATNLITEQILESTQLLESFGNAKTTLNNNSSRFGKLLELKFDLTNGFILLAKIIDLNLLDRTRIVCQNENERNYHIFYELLNGLSGPEKEKYGLQCAEKYFYLNQGHCLEIHDKEDGEDFRSLLAAMQVLGFNHEEQDTIFRILASILHLGNIYFHRKVLAVCKGAQQQQQLPSVEGVEVGSDTEARWVSHLLQVQFDQVMRCLTMRTIETGRQQQQQQQQQAVDCIVAPLNIDQALDTRDAIARALYTSLFKWLVQRINATINTAAGRHQEVDQLESNENECVYLSQQQQQQQHNRRSGSLCEFQPDKLSSNIKQKRIAAASISILDAFGFENLHENNFEQLCINYAAELVQHHTNRHLVRLEQAEYARERIKWRPLVDERISTASNAYQQYATCGTNHTSLKRCLNGNNNSAAVVQLLSKKPLGILALLDDECNFPKATDQSFAEKCHHNHALNDNYQCARLTATSGGGCQEFGVRHFGLTTRMVWYQVDGFIEKNRDSLRTDALDLLLSSRMTIVADMLRKHHNNQNNINNKLLTTPEHASGGGGGGTMNSSSSSLVPSSSITSTSVGKTISRTYDGRYTTMKPRAATVAARFQDTLSSNCVIETLASVSQPTSGNHATTTNVWFIYCIKPNRTKSSRAFDVAYVQDQVRALNLCEIVHARKFGYPIRMRYSEFLHRYKCLITQEFLLNSSLTKYASNVDIIAQLNNACRGTSGNNVAAKKQRDENSNLTSTNATTTKALAIRDVCAAIVEFKLLDIDARENDNYQCGLTKMFLSERVFNQLERLRMVAVQSAIVHIQKTWRMYSCRVHFLTKRQASVVIQAHWRQLLARRCYQRKRQAIIALQRRWRAVLRARRERRLFARRRALLAQQADQVRELKAQQAKQVNQTRFRLTKQQQQQQQVAGASGQLFLDIPDTLAHLYRLQRDWLPAHNLSHVNELNLNDLDALERRRRQACTNSLSIPFMALVEDEEDKSGNAELVEMQELLDKLELDEQYTLKNCLARFYPQNLVPQFGYSRLPITRPFSWPKMQRNKRALLKRRQQVLEFTRDNEHTRHFSNGTEKCAASEQELRCVQMRFAQLEQKSIAMYKLILRYIDSDQESPLVDDDDECDNHETKAIGSVTRAVMLNKLLKFKLISDYLSHLCLTEPLLRDEFYLQLISLTWQNERRTSIDNAWHLLLTCLSCFEPLDCKLIKFMLKYAHDNCSSSEYKQQVCKRLFEALRRARQRRRQASKPHLKHTHSNNAAISLQVNALSGQRRFPATILEYLANRKAAACCAAELAVHASCYMDEPSFNGGGVLCSLNDRRDDQDDKSLLINYSNKTLVRATSHATAEQLARTILRARQVPGDNLFGWSLEIQHEGALSEFSSRLRGDDHLFDHFARLELLPELIQLTDEQLETLECEHLDELAGVVQLTSDVGQDVQATSSPLHHSSRRRDSLQCDAMSWNFVSDDGVVGMQPKTQKQSLNNQWRRRSSAEFEFQSSARSSWRASPKMWPASRRRTDDDVLMPQQQQIASAGHRRSMSMHDIQLAPSSALNGRYFAPFGAGPPPVRYAAGPPRARRHSGSWRGGHDLNDFDDNDYQRPHLYAQPAGQQVVLRRRSATPNSMCAPRRSRRIQHQQYVTHTMAGDACAPTSDYASTHSDYEQISSRRRQQQQQRLVAQRRNVASREESNVQAAAAAAHYAATSSAMSDTSEAPSMASHVRAVQVPQVNGDLDKYLDELFNPLLDGTDLGELSDARSMATSIRGTTECGGTKEEQLPQAESCDNVAQEHSRVEQLSPTFESLLQSLKPTSEEATVAQSSHSLGKFVCGDPSLESMNLLELKALNEKLENEIQAAQSARQSLELSPNSLAISHQQSLAASQPPPPPPLPPLETNRMSQQQQQESTLSPSGSDDIYSRAKTIRIGKWRWPPARDEQSMSNNEPSTVSTDESNAPEQIIQIEQQELSNTDDTTPSSANAAVGRLKISTEMKAKLEQLTNGTNSVKESGGGGQLLQVTNSEQKGTLETCAESPKKLTDRRRLLLEHQLLGAHRQAANESAECDQSEASSRSMNSSKVLAAKQQLAAAAGVALAQLDAHSVSDSAHSSRRTSAQMGAQAAAPQQRRELELENDELGPQSRAAISQRQAFYLKLDTNDTVSTPAKRPIDVDVDRSEQTSSAFDKRVGGMSRREMIENGARQNDQGQWISLSPATSGAYDTRAPLVASKSNSASSNKLRAQVVVNKRPNNKCLTYAHVDWQVRVRKELFMPSESYHDELVVQLVFAQLVADVFNPRHWTRLNNKERAAIKSIMKDNSIGYAPSLPPIGQLQSVKRELVRMARSFGLYFTRSYQALNFACLSENLSLATPQSDGDDSNSTESSSTMSCSSSLSSCGSLMENDNLFGPKYALQLAQLLRARNCLGADWIDMVAVHHTGLRLVVLVCEQQQQQFTTNRASMRNSKQFIANHIDGARLGAEFADQTTNATLADALPPIGYKVLDTLKFRDMTGARLISERILFVEMRNGKQSWLISSSQANQLATLLKNFHFDYNNRIKPSSSTSENNNNNSEHNSTLNQVVVNANKQQLATGITHACKQSDVRRPQNALLACNDDHDDDHFAQRQASNCVNNLRSAPLTNNVLVDNKRVLHNNLANFNAPPSATTSNHHNNQQQHQQQHKQHKHQQQRQHQRSKQSTSPSTGNKSTLSSERAINNTRARSNSSSGDKQSSSGPNQSLGCVESQQQHADGRALDSGRCIDGQSSAAPPTTSSNEHNTCSSSPTTATGEASSSNPVNATLNQPKRHNSLWQNSLSRMSSRFSLFGGGGSIVSSTSSKKRAKNLANKTKAHKSSVEDELAQQVGDQSVLGVEEVKLDAWIETKVDFNDDSDGDGEDEEEKSQKSDEHQTSSVSGEQDAPPEHHQQASQKAATQQQQQRDDGKHSMLQFALHNFREALDKYPLDDHAHSPSADWSTLRGSLKLIESLRNGSAQPSGNAVQLATSSRRTSSATTTSARDEWTWRELAEMVKFTRTPIKRPLLRLPSELDRRAIDCFVAIMKYMGDLDLSLSKCDSLGGGANKVPDNEVECVYFVLINCHNQLALRDEIYCQLMKQTTNNRSDKTDSCVRGWRLFSLLAAYFDCSDRLRPYLLNYLEQNAYDKRRSFHSVAGACLQNLRQTLKHGGRKNVPSIEEIVALSAGRVSKRQIYRLPGGTERVINTKSTTVVEDIISEICTSMLLVHDPNEMLEFSLYCIADGDLYTMPLARDEYILDVTTELIKNHQQYFLIFCRSIWHYPLRLDSKLYIEVTFNQIAPDYLEGLLCVLPGASGHSSSSSSNGALKLRAKLIGEIARLAALLHRASGTDHVPHKDEIRYLLPKPIVLAIKQLHRVNKNGQKMLIANQSENNNNINHHSSNTSSDNFASQVVSSPEQLSTIQVTSNSEQLLVQIPTQSKWIELVQEFWREMSAFDTLDAKAQFLDIVRHWPLFGSSFFAIKLIQRDLIQAHDYILALNKLGIQMLNVSTHETEHKYFFNEVISTRKVRSEDGALYLDLKCGNLMKRTIIRLQTDQAHEISRLIRQYIDIELIHLNNKQQQQQQVRRTSTSGDADDDHDQGADCDEIAAE